MHSINRLDETISEILIYSRNSRKGIEPEHFNLRDTIRTIFEDLRFVAPDNYIFNCEFEGEGTIFHDRYRLNIILKNLISNSVKYCRAEIQNPGVTVRVIHKPNDHAGSELDISVTDNGKGIDTTHQPRVFEMFYRATSESVGTGLGLYICAEMVKKLGGSIRLSSSPDVGTIVICSVPPINPA